MTRVADADFLSLIDFLREYRTPDRLGAQVREALLKRVHKHLLASLLLWERLNELIAAGEARVASATVPEGEISAYIGEFFSDLVGSLACASNGLYKPANFLLRSSVENLVRGVAGVTSVEARQTTVIHRLFELASNEAPFVGNASSHFIRLKQVYGDLCLFVHSASPAHRTASHELSSYFRQDTAKFRNYVLSVETISRCGLSILVLASHNLYNSLHHRSRDLLDEVLPSGVRLNALGA